MADGVRGLALGITHREETRPWDHLSLGRRASWQKAFQRIEAQSEVGVGSLGTVTVGMIAQLCTRIRPGLHATSGKMTLHDEWVQALIITASTV